MRDDLDNYIGWFVVKFLWFMELSDYGDHAVLDNHFSRPDYTECNRRQPDKFYFFCNDLVF